MAQLKMYWFADTKIDEYELPDGYSISNYKKTEDMYDWLACCRNGGLLPEGHDAELVAWFHDIYERKDLNPFEDVFFIDYHGEHVGSITAYVHKDDGAGDVHMVGIREDFRGKGLAKYMTEVALKHLKAKGVKYAHLTTDEWRKPAVKSYLKAGFHPVEYDVGMLDRWEAELEEIGVESADMYYEDGTFFRTAVRKSKSKKIRIGVVGAGRGTCMMEYCRNSQNAVLTAVCDNFEPLLEKKKEEFAEIPGISYFTDYDEFLKSDIDCVVLANYANEHAPFAIKALNAGKHVLSEVLPVQNPAEAVRLIETIERTGLVYAYAENCCYMPAPRKMRELYKEGKIGEFEYGEGEYLHNCEPIWHKITQGDPLHWRNTMSSFYYCTHSIGPLVHITGLRPVSVSGFELPRRARAERMGILSGTAGIEMITLENGAVIKSVHGYTAKNSLWFSAYGTKGRLESAREDDKNADGVCTLYANYDEWEGQNRESSPETVDTEDGLTKLAAEFGHDGSDYYVMHNFIQAVKGNKYADIIDIYEALDMFMPGYFAFISARHGGIPAEIPDFRDKAVREKYKYVTTCCDPKNKEFDCVPSYTKGEVNADPGVYGKIRKLWEEDAPVYCTEKPEE